MMLLFLFALTQASQYSVVSYYGSDSNCNSLVYAASVFLPTCIAVTDACVCTSDLCVKSQCLDDPPNFDTSNGGFVEETFSTGSCSGAYTSATFTASGCNQYAAGFYYKSTCENNNYCYGIYTDASCSTPLVTVPCHDNILFDNTCQDFSTASFKVIGCGPAAAETPTVAPSDEPATPAPEAEPTQQPTEAPTDCLVGTNFACRSCGDVCPTNTACINFLGETECRNPLNPFDSTASNTRVRAAIVDFERFSTGGRTVSSITFSSASSTHAGLFTFAIRQTIPFRNIDAYLRETLIPLIYQELSFLLESPCFGRCLYPIIPPPLKRDELQAVYVGVAPGYNHGSNLAVQVGLSLIALLAMLLI